MQLGGFPYKKGKKEEREEGGKKIKIPITSQLKTSLAYPPPKESNFFT